jgi:SsrA-binding protein
MPTYITNRKAYRDYTIIEEYEAGIKLLGHEVKSIKEGKGTFLGSFIIIRKGNILLKDLNIPEYSKSGLIFSYNPKRTRKLLMHKEEINSLAGKVERQGFTLIPIKIYSSKNLIKILIGLAKGKKKVEKKSELIKKQQEREVQRTVKEENL